MENKLAILYEVTYESNGFVQQRGLVTNDDYDNILKPLMNIITKIEDSNKGRPTKDTIVFKQFLKEKFGDYKQCFREGSPLGESIKTGIIALPEIQGGNHKVSWKRVK